MNSLATATAVATATTEIASAAAITPATALVLLGACLCVAIGAFGCAIAQGKVIAQVADSMARQPESANDLRGTMIIGLAMVESLSIYCLLISLLIIFLKS